MPFLIETTMGMREITNKKLKLVFEDGAEAQVIVVEAMATSEPTFFSTARLSDGELESDDVWDEDTEPHQPGEYLIVKVG